MVSGAKASLQASVVSGALYFTLMKYSPFFKNVFSVSARTALTVRGLPPARSCPAV
jgi:hypothetical protein